MLEYSMLKLCVNYQNVVPANILPEHRRYVLILLNIIGAPGYLTTSLDDEEYVCSGMCLVFAFRKPPRQTKGGDGEAWDTSITFCMRDLFFAEKISHVRLVRMCGALQRHHKYQSNSVAQVKFVSAAVAGHLGGLASARCSL